MRGEWTRKTMRKAYRRVRGLPPPAPPEPPPPPPLHAFESSCYAPSTSMYFDQFGGVRACCQNTGFLLGDIRTQSIREIWNGGDAKRLRAALNVGDYSLGCGFCQWQHDQGDDSLLFARNFDSLPVSSPRPEWPMQMEFSMTNSCNLQCVMCNGDWSSSIRAHREGRPPLPAVYGDEFFNELQEFLPHLVKVNILGGEPFLGAEPLRLLSMLSEMEAPPHVTVTTNGTQWTPRIEAICERLPISFVLSLDGITKETYEAIRVGADFDAVMANLGRFQRVADNHGMRVTLAHCLMRPNFREFGQLLAFAEARGLEVGINEVLFPTHLSLYQLPATELREVIAIMERDDGGFVASLRDIREVWDGQVAALRHRLEVLERGSAVLVRPWADPSARAESWQDLATRVLREWMGRDPTRLVIRSASDRPEVQEGRLRTVGLLSIGTCRSGEDVVEHLASQLGADVPRTTGSSDLVHDVILGEDLDDSKQYRVAWDDSLDATTVLVAMRPWRPWKDDHAVHSDASELTNEYGEGHVLTLVLDPTETIENAVGSINVIRMSQTAEVVGLTAVELMERLEQQWGPLDVAHDPNGTWITGSTVDDQAPLRLRMVFSASVEGVQLHIADVDESAPGPAVTEDPNT